MKKLLDSDWLRAVQLKSNTSAKYKIIKIHESDLQSTGVRDWNILKNFHKPPITFENFPRVSEVFRAFLNTSEDSKNFQKVLEECFENLTTFSDFFRRFPKTSNNFRWLAAIFGVFSSLQSYFG